MFCCACPLLGDLFQKGLDRGDIKQGPDGFFYMKRAVMEKTIEYEDKTSIHKAKDIATDEAYLGLLGDLKYRHDTANCWKAMALSMPIEDDTGRKYVRMCVRMYVCM